MAEPKVGMLFGTYNTLSKQNDKYYKKTDSKKESVPFFGKTLVKVTEIWADPNNYQNTVWGHKTYDQKGAEYPQDAADLTVLYGPNGSSSLRHMGNKRTEDGNFIFKYIYGEDTYAEDIDGDGIVDEGEIFKIEKY